MIYSTRLKKFAIVITITVLIILNLYTFIIAYPETNTINAGINTSGTTLAKDFSAYYVGAWRLWNNPSHIYTFGALLGGEPVISPHPEAFKYLPSFLLLITPLLALNYQQALLVFDIAQFVLLPFIGYFLCKLLDNKPLAITIILLVIALLLPFPTPQKGFSISYYWQWGEGQAKVLVTFLLLLSFYLGNHGRPILSGITLAFGFFDPRFGLLALPLFIFYNRKNLVFATASTIFALVLSNLMLLYPGMESNFLSMVFASAVTTPLYYYALIPLFTLLSLIIANSKEMIVEVYRKAKSAKDTDTP